MPEVCREGWGFTGRYRSRERHPYQKEQPKQKFRDGRASDHLAWPSCPLHHGQERLKQKMMLEGKMKPEQQGLMLVRGVNAVTTTPYLRGLTQYRFIPPLHNSSMLGLNLWPHGDSGIQASSDWWLYHLVRRASDSFTRGPAPGQYTEG